MIRIEPHNPAGEEVEVQESRRRRTVAIQVLPDDRVRMLVPQGISRKYLEQILNERKYWIENVREKNREARNRMDQFRFQNGGNISIGDEILTVRFDPSLKHQVFRRGSELRIPCRSELEPVCREQAIKRFEKWCRLEAGNRLEERVEYHANRNANLRPRKIALRTMKSRWGSCGVDGRILFNWKILFAPERIQNYLVAHELGHLIHHNHSPDFWELVSSLHPDYKADKEWLRKYGRFLDPLAAEGVTD